MICAIWGVTPEASQVVAAPKATDCEYLIFWVAKSQNIDKTFFTYFNIFVGPFVEKTIHYMF